MMYVVYKDNGVAAKTVDPNEATAIALSLSKETQSKVKVVETGFYGRYSKTPGAPYEANFDWERSARQLMA